jgi:hypothetical protein
MPCIGGTHSKHRRDDLTPESAAAAFALLVAVRAVAPTVIGTSAPSSVLAGLGCSAK